jgi:hypothetical protein
MALKFQEFSNYDKILFENRDIRAYDKNKISQFDLLWLDKDKDIIFAFEIENTTNIKSALERFYSLLNAGYSAVLGLKRMFIIIPNEISRINLLNRELNEGTFSGERFHMKEKVKYAFIEDINRQIQLVFSLKEMDNIGYEAK